jgi:hypothetical protein
MGPFVHAHAAPCVTRVNTWLCTLCPCWACVTCRQHRHTPHMAGRSTGPRDDVMFCTCHKLVMGARYVPCSTKQPLLFQGLEAA